MPRRRHRDAQYTFVPEGEIQPEVFQPQPSVKEELFDPDMTRFFPLDWKFVRIGHKQWQYLSDEADGALAGIRRVLAAIVDLVVDGRKYHEVAEEFGLPEAWEEYGQKLRPLHQAYPQYLEWFARQVEREYHGLVGKWSSWFDAAVEDEFSPEFWALDCKVCAYEDFMKTVIGCLPLPKEKEVI